jgi:hypothetical protein
VAGEQRLVIRWREGVADARVLELNEELVAALVSARLGVRAVGDAAEGEGAALEEAFAALTKGGAA